MYAGDNYGFAWKIKRIREIIKSKSPWYDNASVHGYQDVGKKTIKINTDLK